ncbi:hypothetical protein [Chitinophaga solisilvae]|uniref:Lipoprotein n=1 Tax=Chitinophaga solisilvae TaxID=1233460 RepID=A0A9Q5D8X7_9BACT|nr:hypothetical protein [Chitinophaga solisilvae]NSL90189.1 hypothetical protein [Chitinophaga solisilvae]
MKLPKSLLGAILIGITVQTTTSSCKKEKELTPQEKKEAEKKDAPKHPEACIACGMG